MHMHINTYLNLYLNRTWSFILYIYYGMYSWTFTYVKDRLGYLLLHFTFFETESSYCFPSFPGWLENNILRVLLSLPPISLWLAMRLWAFILWICHLCGFLELKLGSLHLQESGIIHWIISQPHLKFFLKILLASFFFFTEYFMSWIVLH